MWCCCGNHYRKIDLTVCRGYCVKIDIFAIEKDGRVEGVVKWHGVEGWQGVDCRYKMPQFYKIKVYSVKF